MPYFDSPDRMVPGTYTTEMQAEIERISSLLTEGVDFTRPPDEAARQLDERNNAIWNIDLPDVKSVRHLKIPSDPSESGAAACEAVVYEPENAGEGLILYVHGGGWAFMNLATHDRLMRLLCNESRKTVVGVHYRLAPENPYPAGLKDIVSAFRTILSSRADYGLPKGPVVIAGDSAGGNLAMALMLHEIDAERELPAGALLFYGVFGADFDTPSYKTYAEDHLLTSAIMQQLWDWYVPDREARTDPHAAPLAATDDQLCALPPLLLVVAEMDPLASDSYILHSRLTELGRHDQMIVEPGVVHGFLQMTAVMEAARGAVRQAGLAVNRFMAAAT
jgi:acetyl esterase